MKRISSMALLKNPYTCSLLWLAGILSSIGVMVTAHLFLTATFVLLSLSKDAFATDNGPVIERGAASAFIGDTLCREGYSAPRCSYRQFGTTADLAYVDGPAATPVVSSTTIDGFPVLHHPEFINDGFYGNGSSWIGDGSVNTWLKIDLGSAVVFDTITFGRDRLVGGYDDRDPGQFMIDIAQSDAVFADGDSADDSTDYANLVDSATLNFSGDINGAETIIVRIGHPVTARYIKMTFASAGAAIDEVEVFDTTAPTVTLNAVTSPTNATSQTITGTVEAGATVNVATNTAASDGAASVNGTSWSYTITGLVSGANGITVTATDAANNTATATGSITLDTSPPTVTLNAVTSPTNATSQTITGTVEVGATVNVATNTAASDGAATVDGTSWSYAITGLVSGANGITVTATDAANNTVTVTGSIRLDVVAPNGSVRINNNDDKSYASAVTLNLAATDADGVTGYYTSEISTAPSSGAAGWHAVASTTTYSANVPFTLSAGLGRKTVFVWYKDAAGNVSNAVYDQIQLEKEFPDVTFFRINNGAANTSIRTVRLNNEALGSPTYYMASESAGFAGATWIAYSTAPQFTLSAGYGGKTVYFKVKNGDDVSAVVHDGITLVQVPVVAQFQINNGAAQTLDNMVKLNNIVTGGKPTHFMASESPLFANAVWMGYSTAPSFRLSEGAGAKTVYFKVKNADGESAAVNDSIVVGKKSPTVATFQVNNGASETRTRTVRLNNTTKDGKPTYYMASESPAFVNAHWQGYNVAPTFALSAGNGAKTVYFKVNNSYGVSPTASDSITLRLAQAVAHAGVDQIVRRGSVVTLDGSKSFGAEGCGPLTYEWSIVSRPAGMRGELSDTKSVSPTLTLGRHGACELSLVVTDRDGIVSEPDSVIISTQNTTPVANAGSDQFVSSVGSRVTLDGSQSYDPDNDSLAYQWVFVSTPAGSAAIINNANTVVPSFVADVPGDFVAQLTVTDGRNNRSSDTVVVSFGNVRPTANAGKSLSAKVGDTVTLTGSGTDANGDALSYRWALISLPAGSLSEPVDSSARVTTFIPDRAGVYVAQLVVSDSQLDSEPSSIQIQVYNHQTAEITALQEMAMGIAELDSSAFKYGDMQLMLLNKLNGVIANVEVGNHKDAANQLRNDLAPKMGGAENTDRGDVVWITDSRSHQVWQQKVQDVVMMLEMAR